MPTSYTSLIGLALPVTGELSGTWGDVVNNYITNYLDSAVAGTQTISGSQTAVTLSVTNGSSLVTAGSGATGSAQFQIINCTGNPAGLLTITAPASSRQYIIINATSTSQSVKIVGTGPTTGVTLIAGEKAHVAWNGSDFVKIATTAAAGGSNTQVQYNSSGVLAGSSNLTFDGTTLTANALTITNNPTLNGGTANGVLYLNGSKVATSGSALTFDGTNFATTGTASATKLIPTGGAITGNGMYLPAANSVSITTNGANAIYIDANQNVGFGTTLAAWGSGAGMKAIQMGGTSFSFLAGSVTQYIYGNAYYDGTNNRYINNGTACSYGVNASGQFQWFQAASGTAGNAISFTQAMTLDTSGNLGLGATPAYRLDVSGGHARIRGAQALFWGNSDNTNFVSIYNGGSSGASTGQMIFETNGTEKMRLDASGNLGLGVTPSAWSGFKVLESTNGNSVYFGTSQASLGSNAYNDGAGWKYKTTAAAGLYTNVQGTHTWYQAASGTAGTAISLTQAMTLDSSGNLGVGETSLTERVTVRKDGTAVYCTIQAKNANSTATLNIGVGGSAVANTPLQNNAYIINAGSSALVFGTSDTERARITSGGDLLVGTTSNIGVGYRSAFVGGGNVVGAQSTTSTNLVFAGLNSSGTVTFSVTGNGAVSKASGSFRIPHPLPAKENTHQLVHSFIEGPQADLIYRGKAALVNGRASVNIDQASGMTDGTFVVLCRDVQCFTSNETDWDAVRGTVVGNILTIECQNELSTATVSWMVIGERQDKHMYDTDWTDDNGKVIVEPLIKPMVNV